MMAPMAPISASAPPSFLDTLQSARQGMESGVRSFEAVAQAVAADGALGRVEPGNTTAALEARNQVAAAARLFQAGDQMLGTLLDLRA